MDAQLNDWTAAKARYESAAKTLAAEDKDVELTRWYRQRAISAQRAKQWQSAKWYLNKLIPDDSDNWQLYAARAEAHRQLTQVPQ